MKSSINTVQLLGHLGADPDVKKIDDETTLVRLRLATNSSYKDRTTGEYKDNTQWHNLVAWNKTALRASEQLIKGSRVLINGSLENNSWTDSDGTTRYATNIKVYDFFLVDRMKKTES